MQRQVKGTIVIVITYKIFGMLFLLMAGRMVCQGQELAGGDKSANGDRWGSICVITFYEQAPVPGGSMTLYQVGVCSDVNETGNFQFTETFAGCDSSLPDSFTAEYAVEIADYAFSHGVAGTTINIGSDGIGRFANLQPGLYLLVQTEAADGYQKTEPFLAVVPAVEEGRLVYEVEAYPKMERVSESLSEEQPPEASDMEGTESAAGGTANVQKTDTWFPLPQTGQLKWPVPILALAGLVLIVGGRCIQRKKSL